MLLLAALALQLTSVPARAAPPAYVVDRWDVDAGLPNNAVTDLLQSRDATMWIGLSGTGLVRWHGHVLETLTPADGLAGFDVRALAVDSDGRIWVGTEGGVSVIEPRSFDSVRHALAPGTSRITTYRVANGLPDTRIRDLAPGNDGYKTYDSLSASEGFTDVGDAHGLALVGATADVRAARHFVFS